MATNTVANGSVTYSVGSTRVDISLQTGAIIAITDGDWAIFARPELAQAFRLLIPVGPNRANWATASGQLPPTCRADEHSFSATWNQIVDQHGQHHEITVAITIGFESDRIVFGAEIDNRSDYVVENVYYPDFGDLTAPPQTSELRSFVYQYGHASRSAIRPHFDNHPGYFGVDHPTLTDGPSVTTPQAPWILFEDGRRGIYLGVDEPSAEPVTWFAELLPGYRDSLESQVPHDQLIDQHQVAVHAAAVHLPFVLSGESRKLTPIAFAVYAGDWHNGADCYLRRRDEWDRPASRGPAWVREPHSWLQFQVNSPEGERRTNFAELVQVAAECAEAGVTAIQLVGWNEGGQDQNNPSHDADEALGGRQGLIDAIQQCHGLGVKIILFSKFTWADRATERFRKELINEAIKDPYGDYYMHPGYRYQTVTQLLDINTKRLVPMCFGSERYLAICAEEFDKIISYGADGILYDEAQHHGPALVCFDTAHGHREAYPAYADDRNFISRFRQHAGLTDQFLFAGECPYDWMYEEYDLGYFRTEDRQHTPVSRYLRPHSQQMTAVTGFDDRNMLNQCLLYRYVISYEPFNFKGRLPDAPRTVAYGRLVDALRLELREWVWDATFVDTVGVDATTADGSAHHPATGFRHQDGRLAAVVANYDDELRVVRVRLDGAATNLRYRLVDNADWRDAADGLQLPPRSAAVVLPANALN